MPQPDYQRIAQLERELGIDSRPETLVRPSRGVCLIKNCTGVDTEFRTWSAVPIRRTHEH